MSSLRQSEIKRKTNETDISVFINLDGNGISEIKDAQELRVKETDRLKVMARQLQKFGAEITEKEDGLIINGQSKLHSAEVDSETDHRVAMSLAIASLLAKGTSKIMRSDAASVSYPTFWEELAKLTN